MNIAYVVNSLAFSHLPNYKQSISTLKKLLISALFSDSDTYHDSTSSYHKPRQPYVNLSEYLALSFNKTDIRLGSLGHIIIHGNEIGD